ncbi:MAG TPA: DNA-processing protein DprA [Syntrophales bacterium]|nr:DNA-processing protein DprA [Syntrophales bacterium]
MERNSLTYWTALSRLEGVGAESFRALLSAFGAPERVFAASPGELRAVPGIGPKTVARIREFDAWRECEAEIARTREAGITLLCSGDPSFPQELRSIYDCPPLLYVKGSLPVDEARIAVVGSRRASPYGRYATQKLCRELALKGVVVVSGLARGIDTAAHEGALSGRGRTIAVLGCGIDVIYPPENGRLYPAVAGNGALVSEYPLGTEPLAKHFPARNRIISGLSLGVVVVEAGEKSGSLITVRYALEQGREVFAVPGAIDAAGSRGTHRLIKDGAKLVEDVEDILEEIRPRLGSVPASACRPMPEAKKPPAGEDPTGAEGAILRLLAAGPRELDGIAAAAGLNAQRVLELLTKLEIAGRVTQLPGKRFVAKE